MEAQYGVNVFEQVVQSRGMVLFVLLVLIAMSLISWFIIAYKSLAFRQVHQENNRFLDAFWKAPTLEAIFTQSLPLKRCSIAKVFRAAYREHERVLKGSEQGFAGVSGSRSIGFENIERALRRAGQAEVSQLERMLPFLASTGSAAPFIGLFGTVWGIMNAFAYISPDRPILETVTPHIAQALVATAIGLLAAIPAVMAYNHFMSKVRVISVQMENFSIDFLNIMKRQFFRE